MAQPKKPPSEEKAAEAGKEAGEISFLRRAVFVVFAACLIMSISLNGYLVTENLMDSRQLGASQDAAQQQAAQAARMQQFTQRLAVELQALGTQDERARSVLAKYDIPAGGTEGITQATGVSPAEKSVGSEQ